jgi:hypothetical protein
LVKNERSEHSLVLASLHRRCGVSEAWPHASVDQVWGRGPGRFKACGSFYCLGKFQLSGNTSHLAGSETVAIDAWKPNLRHAISLACPKQASSGCFSNTSVAS